MRGNRYPETRRLLILVDETCLLIPGILGSSRMGKGDEIELRDRVVRLQRCGDLRTRDFLKIWRIEKPGESKANNASSFASNTTNVSVKRRRNL